MESAVARAARQRTGSRGCYARRVRPLPPPAISAPLFIASASCSAAPTPARPTSTTSPIGAPADVGPGRILYSKAGVGLWTSAPDGTGRAALTTNGSDGGYAGARWSPNGALVAAERYM